MIRRHVGSIVAAWVCLALGCSPKVAGGEADVGVDAVGGDGLGSVGDGEGDGVEEIVDADADGIVEAEVISDADAIGDADAIADVDTTTDTIADAAEVDAAPIPLDCTAGAMPAQADGFVLTDVGPIVPNKVVTGCGKGKPEPVAQPTQCGCDCPPPYSCYCNGECAWLRTPDLNIPAEGGIGVWTGKWVVAATNYLAGYDWKPEPVFKVAVERWNPQSAEGFLLSVPPSPDLLWGQLRLYVFGDEVLVTTENGAAPEDASGLSPKRPAYWYDPETDKYEAIVMPSCSGLVATATHLACCDGGFGGDKGAVHLYDVAAKTWTKVKAPAGLLPVGANICWVPGEDLVADAENLYFIGPVSIFGTAVWPDGSKASDGGHVIRYDIPGGSWKDLGSVPTELLKNQEFTVPISGSILFGVTAGGLKLGQFDLTTGKTKVVTANADLFFPGDVLPLDCGLLISTANYIGPIGPRGQSKKSNVPAFIRPDLSIELFPNWGFPNDDRGITTALKTDKELLVLGGYSNYEHRDGYRYPLSQVCKGAKP